MSSNSASADFVNGGFESGTFSGWTVVNQLDGTLVSPQFPSYAPHSGTYFAALGNRGSDATVSQTIVDTAGQNYVVGFWLASDGDQPNDLKVQFGGQTLINQVNLAAFSYTHFTFSVVGSGSDTISFTERNDPGFFSLDDVSISLASVPEPSAFLLMSIAGVLGLGGVWSRNRSRRAA